MSHPTPQEVEEKVQEYANRFGGVLVSFPETPLADSEGPEIKFVRQALLSVYNSGRRNEIERTVVDLTAVLIEQNVTDEWRLAEVEAIISLRNRDLQALSAPYSEDKELDK